MLSTHTHLDTYDALHSWHPFTPMAEYLSYPQVHIERGAGCWLYDTEGRRYLDCNASVWTNVHGHNDAELNQALTEQLGRIAHPTYLALSNPQAALLAKTLCVKSGLSRVSFSDNGSTAIETALKQSFRYWQLTGNPEKTLAIGLKNGYHGDTLGAMSVGAINTCHAPYKAWHFLSLAAEAAYHESEVEAKLAALEQLLDAQAKRTACLVMEPCIQAHAGMLQIAPGFLKGVSRLCKAYDVHLILDEIFTAFGRLGRLFASEEEAVVPDFLCLAKGLGAGYFPIAATLTKEAIYEAFLGPFEAYKTFFHGHTFAGNPLGCAVALKNIQKLDALIASRKLDQTIQYFNKQLKAHFGDHPNIASVRTRGLVGAVDLIPRPIRERRGMQVAIRARQYGLMHRPILDTLIFTPPLIISEPEIDHMIEGTLNAIKDVLC